MKKILACLMIFALLLSSALAEVANESNLCAPGEKLGMNLLSMLHVSGENTIVSPQSLSLALGMAAEGAQGETLAEILTALDVKDISEIVAALPEGLKSANAVFSAPELVLEQTYIDRLNEGYAAQWFALEGDVVEKVNQWTQENTDGLIEEMLHQSPAADIGLILMNAVAMDAEWTLPFDPELTDEAVFHTAEGDETVQMMHQKEFFDYAEKDGVQIVRLPYQSGKLEMWIALPEAGGMADLLETLAKEGAMNTLKGDVQPCEVELSLPKMDISDENTLSAALQLLGVEQAFGTEADFSGISDTPLCVDEILQKVRVQVDEAGTKAAAATAILMRCMSTLAEEAVEMNVNRPFVFVISDAETGSVCFAGAVENPNGN